MTSSKPQNRRSLPARLLLITGFSAASLTPGLAQETASPPDPVIHLSPFQVNSVTDRGYIATRSSSSTKTDTPLIELPHSIQVLNKEFIDDTGATTLQQAIRFTSNVSGGDTRGDGFIIRGFGTTILRNGLSFTSSTNNDPIAFERVEVVKGASAVLYGTSAPGGLINLVDKKPLARAQTTIQTQAGSYDFYKASIDTTGPVARLGKFEINYRAIGAYEDSQSFLDHAYRQHGFLSGALGVRRGATDVTLRFTYQHDNVRESFTKPYVFFPAGSTNGVLLNLPDNFYRGELTDYRHIRAALAEAVVEHQFSSSWAVRWVSRYNDSYDVGQGVFISNQGTSINLWPRNSQLIQNDEQQRMSEINILGKFKIGPSSHQVLAGANLFNAHTFATNYRYNLDTPAIDIFSPVYGAVPTTEVLGVRRLTNTITDFTGYFLQDQFSFGDGRLNLVAGIRKDELKQNVYNLRTGTVAPNPDDQVSPRYGALWRASKQWSVYVSYNESFTPASGASSFQGVPFPSPTAEQTEGGVKFELLDGRLNGGASVFQNTRRNQVTTDPINPSFSIATGEITSKGAEIDIGVDLTKQWQLIAGAGWIDATITSDSVAANVGRGFVSVPKFTTSAWTKYDFKSGPLKGVSAGFGIVHEGERWANTLNTVKVPGYTIFNALVGYNTGPHRIALNLENLFDKSYVVRVFSERAALPGPPLSLKLTYTLKL